VTKPWRFCPDFNIFFLNPLVKPHENSSETSYGSCAHGVEQQGSKTAMVDELAALESFLVSS
jgi:hypothetical protein